MPITLRFRERHLAPPSTAPISAEFAKTFTIEAKPSPTITLDEVYLALAKTPIERPAGVEANFDFGASFDAGNADDDGGRPLSCSCARS